MRKLNSKGFTLIELLAVITIMGILMLVAIPAVSRTIENSRRDTFMDTAKSYVNAMKTAVAADEIACHEPSATADTDPYTTVSALPTGDYYYEFASDDPSGTDLLEQGGKSSWGNSEVEGYIKFAKTASGSTSTYVYSVSMVDKGAHGFTEVAYDSLSRADVKTGGVTYAAPASGSATCKINA